jgi:hypothetical protein
MKIRPVGTELFHADGPTDEANTLVTFRNFVKAPKNGRRYSYSPALSFPNAYRIQQADSCFPGDPVGHWPPSDSIPEPLLSCNYA